MTHCNIANTLAEKMPPTPDIFDSGTTIVANVNNLVENYACTMGPCASGFTSTAEPKLVPIDLNNPYYLFALSPDSAISNIGATLASGGAPILVASSVPTLGQWGLIIMSLVILTFNGHLEQPIHGLEA